MKFPVAIATIGREILRREAAGRSGEIADYEFDTLADGQVNVTVVFADQDRFHFHFEEMTAAIRARLEAMPTVGVMQ